MGIQAGKTLARILYESHGEVIDTAVYRDLSYAETPQAAVLWAVGESAQAHFPGTKKSTGVTDVHDGSSLEMGDERA